MGTQFKDPSGRITALTRPLPAGGLEVKLFYQDLLEGFTVQADPATGELDIQIGDDPLLSLPPADLQQGFVPPSYWARLCRSLMPGFARPAVALVGPAGNGKTTTAEQVLQVLGYAYDVIDAHAYMEVADLIGTMTYDPQQGEVWRDGRVTAAFRAGKAVIINEFDALDPRVAMSLQSVMQDAGIYGKGRYVTTANPTEDRVYPAGDCPLIMTMNTYGTGPNRQYVGRNTLDAASMDRITLITTGYEHEARILIGRGVDDDLALYLETWARETRQKIEDNGLKVILSNRTLIRIAETVELGLHVSTAIVEEFFDRLDTETLEILL